MTPFSIWRMFGVLTSPVCPTLKPPTPTPRTSTGDTLRPLEPLPVSLSALFVGGSAPVLSRLLKCFTGCFTVAHYSNCSLKFCFANSSNPTRAPRKAPIYKGLRVLVVKEPKINSNFLYQLLLFRSTNEGRTSPDINGLTL